MDLKGIDQFLEEINISNKGCNGPVYKGTKFRGDSVSYNAIN